MNDVVYAETCVCGAQLTIGRSAGTYLLVQRVRRWSDQHAACAHRYRRRSHGGGQVMRRFRSRPSEVEAIQWTDDNLQDVLEFGLNVTRYEHNLGRLMLLAGKDGAQGWVPVPLGHWIVRKPGDLNHHWPVDPDHFAEKYEPVYWDHKETWD